MTHVSSNAAPCALVVDDDGMVRMAAVDILEEAGFTTFAASSGDKALLVLEEHHACIVLLFTDVQMPGVHDGFALARMVARAILTSRSSSRRGRPSPDRTICRTERASSESRSAWTSCITTCARFCRTSRSPSPCATRTAPKRRVHIFRQHSQLRKHAREMTVSTPNGPSGDVCFDAFAVQKRTGRTPLRANSLIATQVRHSGHSIAFSEADVLRTADQTREM